MFAKIFEQIFDSSIADNTELRHFFMDLLVLAEIDGVVDMTPKAIAARTRIALPKVIEFLKLLETPDLESKTPDENGRRIKLLDSHRSWGWQIVNYDQYRKTASEEQRREKTAARTRAYKSRKALQTSSGDAVVTHGDAPLTVGDAGDAMQRQRQMQKKRQAGAERPSLREVIEYASRTGLAAWKAEDFFNEMEGCGWLDYQHRPVQKWQPVLDRVRVKWEGDGRPKTPPVAFNGKSGGKPERKTHQFITDLEKEIERDK